MNSAKKHLNKNELISYIISVLIHGIILIIFIIVEIKFLPVKKHNSLLQLVVVTPPIKPEKAPTIKSPPTAKFIKHLPKIAPVEIHSRQNKETTKTIVDTTSIKREVNFSKSVPVDTSMENLKYAKTFLDTFLVKHPEYARYILRQQGKNFVNNKNDTMFAMLENQKKINDELHKYLKKNFPEGSEHAIDKNLGPGIHIPIDGVINAIRKIFK